jgi:hypothetical protein
LEKLARRRLLGKARMRSKATGQTSISMERRGTRPRRSASCASP